MPNLKDRLHIYPDDTSASAAVAADMAHVILTTGWPVLGLATGRTPRKVYRELARLHRWEGLSFAGVTTFNLDEYYPMLPEAQHSYHRYMQTALFRHVDINPADCHIPLGTYGSPAEIEARCAAYEQAIFDRVIDYQLLGLGLDGHMGFNPPGSDRYSLTRLVDLPEITREAAAEEFGGLHKVPHQAITMGNGTIMRARRIAQLVLGEHKSEIICETLKEPREAVPSSLLLEHDNACWFLDRAAASKLPPEIMAQATIHQAPRLGGGPSHRRVALPGPA